MLHLPLVTSNIVYCENVGLYTRMMPFHGTSRFQSVTVQFLMKNLTTVIFVQFQVILRLQLPFLFSDTKLPQGKQSFISMKVSLFLFKNFFENISQIYFFQLLHSKCNSIDVDIQHSLPLSIIYVDDNSGVQVTKKQILSNLHFIYSPMECLCLCVYFVVKELMKQR